MAKQKTQKLELATLDANNIAELDGWKEKQEAVIKENPFIEIEDRETYEIAKTRRTALVSARTEIQKQDKLIGSVVSTFRKQTMEIAKELIAITEPFEEKQQSEVSRYEEILDAKRREKELEEENRVNTIKNKIQSIESGLQSYIESMSFETIEETSNILKSMVEDYEKEDFQEFEPMFDAVVENTDKSFLYKEVILRRQEDERVLNLQKDQEAKINELIVRATEMIDETGVLNADTLLKSVETLFGIDFDFGDFTKRKDEAKENLLNKAKAKLESINAETKRRKEIEKQENINRINNVREGLLDKIFQMDADNHQEDLEYIKDALDQDNPFPELEEKFNTMIETVKKNLDSKMKMINAELEQRKQEAIDARIAIDARTAQRGNQLEKIGFIFNEQKTENFWNTLVSDFEVWESMVEGLSDEDWTPYFNEIKKSMDEAKKKNKAHQERQKELKQDKEEMIKTLNDYILKMPKGLKNEESIQLFSEIQKSFNLFRESKIETINKF